MASRLSVLVLGIVVTACASSQPPRAVVAPSHSEARVVAAPVLSMADQERELTATQRSVTMIRWDVQRRLERVRARGDRAEFRCLDERLSEIDASLRTMNEQRERFLFASDGDAAAQRERSFRRAMALRGRAIEVGEEARRCEVGGEVIEATSATVEREEIP